MVSVTRELALPCGADAAWEMLRDPSAAHHAFAGVLTACTMEGFIRRVTFANGMTAVEQILSIDDERRRIAYTVLGDMFTHHSAAMEIRDEGQGRCRFVWSSDFLPEARAATVAPLMEAGLKAFSVNLHCPA